MGYSITGRNTAGAASHRGDTAVEAVKKAVELIGNGLHEVLITDLEAERVYGPEQFDLLVRGK